MRGPLYRRSIIRRLDCIRLGHARWGTDTKRVVSVHDFRIKNITNTKIDLTRSFVLFEVGYQCLLAIHDPQTASFTAIKTSQSYTHVTVQFQPSGLKHKHTVITDTPNTHDVIIPVITSSIGVWHHQAACRHACLSSRVNMLDLWLIFN